MENWGFADIFTSNKHDKCPQTKTERLNIWAMDSTLRREVDEKGQKKNTKNTKKKSELSD